MSIPYYILEDGLPKKVDMMTWSDWLERHPNRDVKRSVIEGTDIKIITVFFPLPETDFKSEGEECKKFLWFYGTMVFGGQMNYHEEKYKTQEEAEDGHERILARVKAVLDGRIGAPECCKKSGDYDKNKAE